MSAYYQMGHDSENLVGEKGLEKFKGIILSPMNRPEDSLVQDMSNFRKKGKFDIVLDPQLYLPRSERLHLPTQPYFPSNFDTADMTSISWWEEQSEKIVSFAIKLGVDAIASPAILPKTWPDEYYAVCQDVASLTADLAQKAGVRCLMTVMLNYNLMDDENSALRLASIVSEARVDGYYLVIASDVDPRREFNGEREIMGIMKFIHLIIKETKQPIIVSHCSSDLTLFKAAGASHCATGKFFNLRRFTKSRYEEPTSGGGQLPYWFEHSLMAFLRGPDVLRLKNKGFEHIINTGCSNNDWSRQILNQFESSPGSPWLALSWRQYMCWFTEVEEQLSSSDALSAVSELLKTAEAHWLDLDDKGLLFDEQRNNGGWLRSWRQAIASFKEFIN